MGIIFKTEEERNPKKVENVEIISENDLTQTILTPEEEGKLAIQFIEETHQLDKFLIWQELKKEMGF